MESLQIEGTPYNLIDIIFITSDDKEQGVIRDNVNVIVYLQQTGDELNTRDSALLKISPQGDLEDWYEISTADVPLVLAEYITNNDYALVSEEDDIGNIENIPQGIENYFSILADQIGSSDMDQVEDMLEEEGEEAILDLNEPATKLRSEEEVIDKILDPHTSNRNNNLDVLAAKIEFFIRAAAYHRDVVAADVATLKEAYQEDPGNPKKMRALLLAKKKLATIEEGLMNMKRAYYDEETGEVTGDAYEDVDVDSGIEQKGQDFNNFLQKMFNTFPDPKTDIVYKQTPGNEPNLVVLDKEIVAEEQEDGKFYVPSLETYYDNLESAAIAYMAQQGINVNVWRHDGERGHIYLIPLGMSPGEVTARNLDGTGPEGKGPMTGRGKGNCDDKEDKKDKKDSKDKNKKDKKDKNKKKTKKNDDKE